MAEKEEFTPAWGDSKAMAPGQYVWTVYLKSCFFRESVKDGETKPYMQIAAIVEDPPDGVEEPYNGTDFNFRVYMNPTAQGWCLYFLKKFGYNEALLANPGKPIIKRAEVAGLHGKVLVNVTSDEQGMLRFDVNGFDHLGGDDLEKRAAKKNGTRGPAEATMDTVEVPDDPVIDLEQDVKQPTPNLESTKDSLDDL
jgi:hypothetical protein